MKSQARLYRRMAAPELDAVAPEPRPGKRKPGYSHFYSRAVFVEIVRLLEWTSTFSHFARIGKGIL